MRAVPRINAGYWLTLAVASIFGTNTGDFVSDYLHLGHLVGLPFLAAVVVVLLIADRVGPWTSAVYFWAVIITVRTAATNVGDSFHDFGLGFGISLPLVLVLFVLSVLLYRAMNRSNAAPQAVVNVSTAYWLCMTLAGIVGTIGGDFASFGIGLRPVGAALVFGAAVLAMLVWGRGARLLRPAAYWLTLGLIRTAGTAAGDAFAHALGLVPSTIATGLVFIGLVAWLYGFTARNQAVSALPAKLAPQA